MIPPLDMRVRPGVQLLFKNYTAKFMEFQKKHGTKTVKIAAASNLAKTRERFGGLAAANVSKALDAQLDKLTQQLDERISDYEANKDARDEEAFRVVDVNNDGELQEEEVLNALTPEHPTHEKFHRALGFNTDLQQREQCAQQ